MRAVFLILLAANLLFLAWARWIDTPSTAAADGQAGLPRLQLATEAPPAGKPISAPSKAVDPGTASTQKTSLRLSDSTQTCTSVGPFNDLASAARAAGLLTQRGFSLRQRAEEGDTIEGYWVFVGGMQSDEDVNRLVAGLEKGGFTDAHVMRNYSTNRRVSVGMFISRERAEKRAAAIRNLGLQPEIGERRFPGTVYWVDVTLERGPGFKKLPPEYSFTDIGHARVQLQPCPATLRPREALPDTPDEDGVIKGLPRTTVASAPHAIP